MYKCCVSKQCSVTATDSIPHVGLLFLAPFTAVGDVVFVFCHRIMTVLIVNREPFFVITPILLRCCH